MLILDDDNECLLLKQTNMVILMKLHSTNTNSRNINDIVVDNDFGDNYDICDFDL